MKRNYFIGLGGSGGKIISELYARLLEERGEGFDSEVECIAIDTDQDELDDLAQLGVKKVCISNSGNVGQLFNTLGDDVGDWCPNTSNEGVFFSSSVFNGASQCRLKSRLCLASFLKNQNNSLKKALEESLIVTSDSDDVDIQPPVILIASSIAGGTGSGIFIQVALYIKKFFREHGVDNVVIHGMFACPDIYTDAVPHAQLPNLYANAYAVIRELNAINLICGSATNAAYGGKINVDIEISTSCEGKLFEKDAAGRYGDKPYDIMYFIDKVNYLSCILGGLSEYYKAMANIAYSHLYTSISGEVLSNESNEMAAHSAIPSAIYASAGAATLQYPFEDMIRYFSNRSIKESFDGIWTELDKRWENYYRTKDAAARSTGQAKYVPEKNERANTYVNDFKKLVKSGAVSKTQFTFLGPQVERDGVSADDKLFALIAEKSKAAINEDPRIVEEKKLRSFDDLDKTKTSLLSKIDTATGDDRSDKELFKKVKDIDDNLEIYCKNCLRYISDMAISFANEIFCDDKTLWETYDSKEYSIIEGLFKKDGMWIHPVAARYLLYSFSAKLDKKIAALINGIDTAADDVDDFYNRLLNQNIIPHRSVLATDDESDDVSNAMILHNRLEKAFGKKAARKGVNNYFRKLDEAFKDIEKIFANALQYFAFLQIRGRIASLISEYELFFDNIGEFVKKASTATAAYENMHDNSRGVIYVCASAEVKDKLYETVGRNIDTQSGETASIISKGLFDSLRVKAAGNSGTKPRKVSLKEKTESVEAFFNKVSDIVAENATTNNDIQGRVDMNVFQAMLCEYSLMNPENANDEVKYSSDTAAKNRIDAFLAGKLAALSRLAAPMLIYDAKDPYIGLHPHPTKDLSVTNAYRYISHNADVGRSIERLLGTNTGISSVQSFYNGKAPELPKDTEKQTIHIHYEESDQLDPHSMICYSTVHCMQPYQIKAFDEIKGGLYYSHYADKISKMEEVRCYSMTPHLDKRWHKHGVMPYINVAKETDRRFDLGEAFLYALSYRKIGYFEDEYETKYAYRDPNLGKTEEIIFYKGKSIPYNKINRAMYWFADQDHLIERYSTHFDALIEQEIEELSKYADTVANYKTQITNQAHILNQIKKKIIRSVQVGASKNGRAKKLKERPAVGLLEFAWQLHVAEENEFDKDYGELLVEMLCEIIKRYAKAPYNADAIANKDKTSVAYATYLEVSEHIKTSFLNDFAATIGEKIKAEIVVDAVIDDAEDDLGTTNFGRSDYELSDENAVEVKGKDGGVNTAVSNDAKLQWATALMNKYIAD